MSLSDCPQCWDTPCKCGHQYKQWSLRDLEEFSAMIQQVIQEKKSNRDLR